ncbi:MAG: polyprenyl synthetase family protein [Flavobacteriaceae bacterium]|nr:polyprenyl synthetase family protein [Flavobacteriaceae bacterium]MDG2234954.1 polyprenyl synthetase family protein [Flavobacteriaceae bacterium]|tara:strand:- start:13508 stop:14488 length:981 start_codon:yes stop_codon:yes gene_type:complete
MTSLKDYKQFFEIALENSYSTSPPAALYQPIYYLLNLGGKRLRPILTLMAADIFGNNHRKAIDAALAVEIFHNFTLMHDDIMDSAPIRRGSATVHNKWNTNTAILSGDAMMILAYQALESYKDPLFRKLNSLFSKTAIEVCKGQQYDLDFETQLEVTQGDYLEMIRLKTAVLVGCSLKMGALIGGANQADSKNLYDFGVLLGIAFQIQDDYLDAYANSESFGKQLSGDIIENKKTILYHQAMENGSSKEKTTLRNWFSTEVKEKDVSKKINAVKSLFDKTGASDASKALVIKYTQAAFEKLDILDISDNNKIIFKTFGTNLMERKF